MTAVSEETNTDNVDSATDLVDLIEAHQVGIWRYLRFLGAAAQEAEDLTQETFLIVTRRPPELRSRAETAAYLRVVARNQLFMLRRRQKCEQNTVDLEAAESVWAELAGKDGSLNTYLDALEACLGTLQRRARSAIDLAYRLGASRGAIAAELNMKPDGVKTLLRRTRQLLRECIERRLKVDG